MAGGEEFGMGTAESGLVSAQNTLTIWANNLANQSTPGFQAAIPELAAGPVAQEPAVLGGPGSNLANSGVLLAPSLTDVTNGPLINTGNPTDFALTVPGYLPVRTPSGVMLTRNGQFSRDAAGELVTSTGAVLLGLNLKPVVVPPGSFSVDNGTLTMQNGTVVAQLGIAAVPNPDGLVNVGGSLYSTSPASGAFTLSPALGRDIVQAALEGANVNLPEAMTALVTTAGQFEQMATVARVSQQLSQITNGLAVLP